MITFPLNGEIRSSEPILSTEDGWLATCQYNEDDTYLQSVELFEWSGQRTIIGHGYGHLFYASINQQNTAAVFGRTSGWFKYQNKTFVETEPYYNNSIKQTPKFLVVPLVNSKNKSAAIIAPKPEIALSIIVSKLTNTTNGFAILELTQEKFQIIETKPLKSVNLALDEKTICIVTEDELTILDNPIL